MIHEQSSYKKIAGIESRICSIFDVYENLNRNSQEINYQVETTFFICNLVQI